MLFVDDEPQVLEGLRHRLHRQRHIWDMRFVGGGREALAVMAKEPVDVIVSDMRMPEMDGATLLRKAQELHPDTVRIVLSGFAELETALRVVPVAHQFLTKPCDADVLENVVARAHALQALLKGEALHRLVGSIDRLPALPQVYAELLAAVARENVAATEIAEILKRDAALATKALQVVNSAFFGVGRPIAKVEDAVIYLGYNTIKQIVLAVEVFQNAGVGRRSLIPLEKLQAHAMMTGSLASCLFKDRETKDDAYVAGLLHDIGKLVLVAKAPERVAEVLAESEREGVPVHVVEARRWGVTHAEVGAHMLGLWGLPYPIVEAVANHHAPGRVETKDFGVLAAAHVADGLMHEEADPTITASGGPVRYLDLDFLERAGFASELPEWRDLARYMGTPAASGRTIER
jgi:putative nucleotidyltransferase with HDIG domain